MTYINRTHLFYKLWCFVLVCLQIYIYFFKLQDMSFDFWNTGTNCRIGLALYLWTQRGTVIKHKWEFGLGKRAKECEYEFFFLFWSNYKKWIIGKQHVYFLILEVFPIFVSFLTWEIATYSWKCWGDMRCIENYKQIYTSHQH